MPTQQKTPPRRGQRTRKPLISPGRRYMTLLLWGIAFLVLLSIPLGKLPVVSLIPTQLKSLIGLGYYFLPISLLVGGYLLISQPGILGSLQALLCCAIPIPIGSIHHAVICASETAESASLSLRESGIALESGGVISGGLAQTFISVLGNTAATVLSALLLIVFLGMAFLPCLLNQSSQPSHNRKQPDRYTARGNEDPLASRRSVSDRYVPSHTPSQKERSVARPRISDYDMPMDGDVTVDPTDISLDGEEAASSGFYVPRSTYAPADLLLKVFQEAAQTPPDASPAVSQKQPEPSKHTEQPKPSDQPIAPIQIRKPPATWKPIEWTTPVRSDPAWAIPGSSTSESPKTVPDETPNDKPQETHLEDLDVSPEQPQILAQSDNDTEQIPEDLPENESVSETISEESSYEIPVEAEAETGFASCNKIETSNFSFVLIGYLKPQKPQRTSRKSPPKILALPPKPNYQALPQAKKPLLLPGHSAVCSVKRLPAPAQVLLLPAPSSRSKHIQIPDEILLSVMKGIPVFKEMDLCRNCFTLIDYRAPQKQIHDLYNLKRKTHETTPPPLLLLPPAILSLLFSHTTGNWILPVPKLERIQKAVGLKLLENIKSIEATGNIEKDTSFILIDYVSPQKREYRQRKSEQEIYSVKELPSAAPLLLLPPAMLSLLFSQYSGKWVLPVPKDFDLNEFKAAVKMLEESKVIEIEDSIAEDTSFVLIDYVSPQKRVYKLRKSGNIIYPNNALPAPVPVLLLPSSPSYPLLPLLPDRLLLPERKDSFEILDNTLEEASFVLVDYIPPQKRIYSSSNTHPSREEIYPAKGLPAPIPVLFLPPAPSRLLLPQSPNILLLPAPKDIIQVGIGVQNETSFELIDYVPPQKRTYHLRDSSPKSNEVYQTKELPVPVPVLFLPPAQVCPQLPQAPVRLLLPMPQNSANTEDSSVLEEVPFVLIDYILPQKRVYRSHTPQPNRNEIYPNNGLPAPVPTLFLPAAPAYLLLPQAPHKLLLPAPQNTMEMDIDTPENTGFILIDYLPPEKRIYNRERFKSDRELPAPIPILLLPPAPSRLLFPTLPVRLRLPAPQSILEGTAFLLINYAPPQKRVYRQKKPPNDGVLPINSPLLLPEHPLPLLLNAHTELSSDVGLDIEDAENMEVLEDREVSTVSPPLSLLNKQYGSDSLEDANGLDSNAEHLSDVLKSFGVKVTRGDVVQGPSITRYEFTLERGVKLSKITNLADDIALALGASGVRIAPVPGKISVVGIEVPNRHISPVYIREVLDSPEFREHKSPVAFAIGKDISNRSMIGDIAVLPHVLIAGTTGSGKSVCTNSLIISILCKASPDDARFIMIDPKMVELAPYNGIPHLLVPVVTDPKKAAGALQWAVFEMMRRYKRFSELGVKKLSEYNARAETDPEIERMSTIVIVIDELADLMLVAAKEVEESICRVAQMGRAAGMHLVIATQRPSSDVITGLMKANIPSRIAFAVASSLESRIILDNSGAEKLVGRGDMLYAPLGTTKPLRIQGCYITPEEIERVVNYVKSTGEAQYSDEVMEKMEESAKEKESKNETSNAAQAAAPDNGDEQLLRSAVEVFLDCGQASVSMLQRRLKLGYSRAARLVDLMEERGYVGPFEGSKARKILISKEEWAEICAGEDENYDEDEYL